MSRERGRNMPHSFSNLLVHAIFSTDHRRKLIDAELKPRLCGYVQGTVKGAHCFPIEVNAVPDHIHVFVQLSTSTNVADLLRVIKSNSTKWVHEEIRKSFGWQDGYAAFSVSESNRSVVVQYIRDQEEHHRRVSFEEELLQYLQKNGISYDERYVWK